jgi:hypothetical protein
MKMVADYMERERDFERMASSETNATLKAELEKQAVAYRTLAAERAAQLGIPPPPPDQTGG